MPGRPLLLILRSCLFDCQALKLLHNSNEFLPYVIFLCPPSVESYNVTTEVENGKPCQTIELAVSQQVII